MWGRNNWNDSMVAEDGPAKASADHRDEAPIVQVRVDSPVKMYTDTTHRHASRSLFSVRDAV